MSDTWDERRRAQEESYFENLNKAALSRLALKRTQPARLSPVTGKPMEQITVMGVVVDRCVDSGGVWLDRGELDEILSAAKGRKESLRDFFGTLPSLQPQSSAVTEGLKSPVSGDPMSRETILGVAVDRCRASQGIWLDARELDRLVRASHQSLASSIADFFSMVVGKQ